MGARIRREAAHAALEFGFAELGLAEIVSFTSVQNERSRAVMRRIGMTRDAAGDFAHPLVARDSALSAHVLYRLGEGDWHVHNAC